MSAAAMTPRKDGDLLERAHPPQKVNQETSYESNAPDLQCA